MHPTKNKVRLAALSAAVLLGLPPAMAQDATTGEPGAASIPSSAEELEASPVVATIPVPDSRTPPPLEPPESDGPAMLDDVVVTATKRPQLVREIPASITAFRGDKLESSGKLNLNDFIQEAPGVTAAQGAPGFTRLTFRGISTDTNPYAGNAQPVGIFIGDTPFTDPYIANIVPDLSAFDLAGVQVLKGPQGTLFGGAALSGAIRYELQEPMLETWQARAFSQYQAPEDGSTAWTHGIALNVPVTDTNIAMRLNYIRREYPGVTDDLRSGEQDIEESSGEQVRAQLLWQPGDWKFKLTHITQDFFGENQLNRLDTPDGPRATGRNVIPEPVDHEFNLDSLEVVYEFETMRATALSSGVSRDAYFAGDTTYVLAGPAPQGYPASAAVQTAVTDNSESFSQELRLQSTGDGDFSWLVGAYYFDYEMFFNILIDTPLNQSLLGPGSLLGENPLLLDILELVGLPDLASATALLDGTSDAESTEKALFADLTWKPWDDLTLTAGGRWYETEVAGGFIGTGLLITGNQNDGLGTNSLAQIRERGFNPKVSATYRFTPDISVYLAAAKGFRFGGLQSLPSTPTNGVPATYKSDTLWNHEIGLRTSWLDKTLQVDLTGFYIKYKDPIITQQTQGIPINYNTNVSGAISRGVEGSILWNTPLNGLTWHFAGGLTDAHITEFFTAAGGEVVAPGTEMPGTAKEQYSTSLTYVGFLNRFTFAPSVSYTWVGKGFNNITHDIEINGFGSLNAGLVLGTIGIPGNPLLAINVTNILDEQVAVTGGAGETLVTMQPYAVYIQNAPRTITARISFEFE